VRCRRIPPVFGGGWVGGRGQHLHRARAREAPLRHVHVRGARRLRGRAPEPVRALPLRTRRTNWTRLVPHTVLIGHVSLHGRGGAARRMVTRVTVTSVSCARRGAARRRGARLLRRRHGAHVPAALERDRKGLKLPAGLRAPPASARAGPRGLWQDILRCRLRWSDRAAALPCVEPRSGRGLCSGKMRGWVRGTAPLGGPDRALLLSPAGRAAASSAPGPATEGTVTRLGATHARAQIRPRLHAALGFRAARHRCSAHAAS